jgi:hypothetical protein
MFCTLKWERQSNHILICWWSSFRHSSVVRLLRAVCSIVQEARELVRLQEGNFRNVWHTLCNVQTYVTSCKRRLWRVYTELMTKLQERVLQVIWSKMRLINYIVLFDAIINLRASFMQHWLRIFFSTTWMLNWSQNVDISILATAFACTEIRALHWK